MSRASREDRDTLAVRITAPADEHGRLIAELHALGTLGIEEREGSLVAWFRAAEAPRRDLEALADVARRIRVAAPRLQRDRDWQALWRRGLRARRIAGLWVRPSFVPSRGRPELIIDPEQAFGTGEHATTRLALSLLLECLAPGERWIDFGAGSAILALAALRSGARAALALEIDPIACATARRNASRNALDALIVCGSLDTLASPSRRGGGRPFDGAVANLLWSRLRPWLEPLAARVDGPLILSGYLAAESREVSAVTRALGLETLDERREAQSGDLWCARRVQASRALQESSRVSSVSSNR
ncbi:MAG: 50S ribosomal protein L11 methyltransferase [Myxococcota bacterium]